MNFIIHLLINAVIVFIVAYIMPSIHIKNYGAAIWVAFLVGILNATVGFLLRLPLDLLTLGLLSFFIRLFVTAIIIKLVDKLVRNFEVKGFMPALVMALVLALVGTLMDSLLLGNG
jgi:putative membrane protein